MKLLSGIMNRSGFQQLADRMNSLLSGTGILKRPSASAEPKPKRRESYMKMLNRRMREARRGAQYGFHRRGRVMRRDTQQFRYISPDKVCRNLTLRYEEIIQKLFFRIKHLRHPVYEQSVRTAPTRYQRGVDAAKIFDLPESKRNYGKTESEFDSPFFLNPAAVFAVKHKRLITSISVLAVVAFLLTSGVLSLINLYTSKTVFIDDEQIAGNITITDRITTTNEMSQKVAYYLLVGVDDSQQLTDCIWIMCYDIAGNRINVMQVPRDTYVGNESANGKFNAIYGNPKKVKFCETCQVTPDESEIEDGVHTVCGTELTSVRESNISATIRAVNEHFGLPIDHFVIFNFRGFARIVDTMGGVDVTLERGIHDSTITLSAGDHHLDGWDAVNYMRHRKSYIEGDVARVSAQRILVNALMQKALDMDLSDMLAVLTKCIGAFQTDMSMQEMTALATQARSLSVEDLEMFTMPGYDYWKKPNPSYYICKEYETAEMINEKLLPYGLPDGSFASDETVNFPSVTGKKTTARTKPAETEETGETVPAEEGQNTANGSDSRKPDGAEEASRSKASSTAASSKTSASATTTEAASKKSTTTTEAASKTSATTATKKKTSATTGSTEPAETEEFLDAPVLQDLPGEISPSGYLSEDYRAAASD